MPKDACQLTGGLTAGARLLHNGGLAGLAAGQREGTVGFSDLGTWGWRALLATSLLFTSNLAKADPATIVTLSFDDTLQDQVAAVDILRDAGMRATFFINSSRIDGGSKYMSYDQILSLVDGGNEIGGHTVYHPHLSWLTDDEQLREICDDRASLIASGFHVTSLAYPFGDDGEHNGGSTWRNVQACGYTSGRDIGGVFVDGGPYAQALPLSDAGLDAFHTWTPDSIQLTDASTSQFETMQSDVLQAENHDGGWVQIVMHHVCQKQPCDPDDGQYAVLQDEFVTFVNWLAGEVDAGRVAVLTTEEVIDGGFIDPEGGPPPAPWLDPTNLLHNPSVELWDGGDQGGNLPDCWENGTGGLNGTSPDASWSRSSDAYDGSAALLLTVADLPQGEVRFVSARDLGECAPQLIPGHQYELSASYKTTGSVVAEFVAYARVDHFYWTTIDTSDASLLAATQDWLQKTWRIPIQKIPNGGTGLSIGILVRDGSAGSIWMDSFVLKDLSLEVPDAGDGGGVDAGLADAGELDAGGGDAGVGDGGAHDAGRSDGGSQIPDAGFADAGTDAIDGGSTDRGTGAKGCSCSLGSPDEGLWIVLGLGGLVAKRRRRVAA